MKVLWALEPCPSIYDGLWAVRRLLPDCIAQERMLFLRESGRGERQPAGVGSDRRTVAFSAEEHLLATVRAFSPDIVVVVMPSLVSTGAGFKGKLPIMVCREAACPVLLVNVARLPVGRLAIVGASPGALEALAGVLVTFAPPPPLEAALWLTTREKKAARPPSEISTQLAAEALQGLVRQRVELLEVSLREAAGRLRRADWSVRHQVLPGAAASMVAAKVVQEDIDLLVCESPRPRSGRLLPGPTAALARVPCSVLAIPLGGASGAQGESADEG